MNQITTTPSGFLPVRPIGLGTMRMADRPDQRGGRTAPIWAPPSDRAALIGFLRRAVELGVNHFDTADAYALGAGEELLAEALAPLREELMIATKVGNLRPGPSQWVPCGHPEYLRQQIELSLRRLRTEQIDLLYLHVIDTEVPLAEQLGALTEARSAGKVARIGVSNLTAAQLRAAAELAPLSAVQNKLNLLDREQADTVVVAHELDLAFVVFFPLAMQSALGPGPTRTVAEIAAAVDASPAQVALAWLLAQGDQIFPIPGTTSIEHLEDNLGAARVRLSAEQLERLDRLV